jgi:porphobilinogen synthase
MQRHPLRPRRLRRNSICRDLIREARLSQHDLVFPLFVCSGSNVRIPIDGMPGHHRLSIDLLLEEIKSAKDSGIRTFLLFGVPDRKDDMASEAYATDGVVQRAIPAIREAVDEILVITDVCLCAYMSHGHCGVVQGHEIVNDPSVELLSRTALSHAMAGADMVAPSDMMDGRVGAIRQTLDENGYTDLPIMAYSAKFSSTLYTPFREACDSCFEFGDRKSYQMDPANLQEALREVDLDIQEGADILMIKPALFYLDVIHAAKNTFNIPIAAYLVSGEFAMIKAAAQLGWLNGDDVMMEALLGIKRAGADMIITYFAKEAAGILASS